MEYFLFTKCSKYMLEYIKRIQMGQVQGNAIMIWTRRSFTTNRVSLPNYWNTMIVPQVAPELGRLFATYQLIPSFQKSEKHHSFVDSLDGVSNLPPPSVPPCKKDDIFDPADYLDEDRRALKVSVTFCAYIHLTF